MNKTKKKLRFWQVGGIAMTFAPIAIAVFINRNIYFATKEAGLSLGVGGIMAIILVACSVLGKAGKMLNSGLKVSAWIFIFALLLEPIILNIKFLSGMMLLGELCNVLFFAPKIRRIKKQLEREETTQVIREAVCV